MVQDYRLKKVNMPKPVTHYNPGYLEYLICPHISLFKPVVVS